MPHKNPRCQECGSKMKHHRWIKDTGMRNYGSEVWDREVICPKCGFIRKDIMGRGEASHRHE